MTLTEFLLARIAEDEANLPYWFNAGDSEGGVNMRGRMLAECEAKQAIVAEHHPVDPCDAHDASFKTIDCGTLRALATVYADHPGYREEWKFAQVALDVLATREEW